MRLLDKLERIFGPLALPNLALYFVIGQVFVLFAHLAGLLDLSVVSLVPGLAMEGEWWRIFSFMFMPPRPGMFGYLFVAFAWYIFFLMGRALEDHWGVFRFNLFIFTGWALTVAFSFLFPVSIVTNAFIAGSVFLAFAYLNPNFEIMLFFILPVKIKWLALVAWIFYAYAFVVNGLPGKLQIVASVANFILFFGADIVRNLANRKRATDFRVAQEVEREKPRHECRICGKTDRTHPQMDFRYCSKCAGDECYCSEHIGNHVHVTSVADEQKN